MKHHGWGVLVAMWAFTVSLVVAQYISENSTNEVAATVWELAVLIGCVGKMGYHAYWFAQAAIDAAVVRWRKAVEE